MTAPTLLKVTFHPTDKVSVKFAAILRSIFIHLSQIK